MATPMTNEERLLREARLLRDAETEALDAVQVGREDQYALIEGQLSTTHAILAVHAAIDRLVTAVTPQTIGAIDILTAATVKELQPKVNAALENGWQPYGNFFVHAGGCVMVVTLKGGHAREL